MWVNLFNFFRALGQIKKIFIYHFIPPHLYHFHHFLWISLSILIIGKTLYFLMLALNTLQWLFTNTSVQGVVLNADLVHCSLCFWLSHSWHLLETWQETHWYKNASRLKRDYAYIMGCTSITLSICSLCSHAVLALAASHANP